MEGLDFELQTLINMKEFEIKESDLDLSLKKRYQGLMSSVKRYISKPSPAQKTFVQTTDAILAHDIQTFAETFHNLEDESPNQNSPMDPNNPPVPPVEPPAPPVEPPTPPVEPPVPPVEPPTPPVEPPAPPAPPAPPKSNIYEGLDTITGG